MGAALLVEAALFHGSAARPFVQPAQLVGVAVHLRSLLAILVVGGTIYMLLPEAFNWPFAPFGLVAVAILASNRAFAIYDPYKFCT